MARQNEQAYKDREYDSDDELKKKMMTFDERLSFITKCDADAYRSLGKTELVANKQIKDSGLPIVLHEREIMEQVENFVVTVVCGETGSGKST